MKWCECRGQDGKTRLRWAVVENQSPFTDRQLDRLVRLAASASRIKLPSRHPVMLAFLNRENDEDATRVAEHSTRLMAGPRGGKKGKMSAVVLYGVPKVVRDPEWILHAFYEEIAHELEHARQSCRGERYRKCPSSTFTSTKEWMAYSASSEAVRQLAVNREALREFRAIARQTPKQKRGGSRRKETA